MKESVIFKDYAEVIVVFIKVILKSPEIMNVLRGMPCLEALGLVLYVGLIVCLWVDIIKNQHPKLFRMLKRIHEFMEIIH